MIISCGDLRLVGVHPSSKSGPDMIISCGDLSAGRLHPSSKSGPESPLSILLKNILKKIQYLNLFERRHWVRFTLKFRHKFPKSVNNPRTNRIFYTISEMPS